MDLVPYPCWGGTYAVGPVKVPPNPLYLLLACVLPLVCFPICGLFEVSQSKHFDRGKLGVAEDSPQRRYFKERLVEVHWRWMFQDTEPTVCSESE